MNYSELQAELTRWRQRAQYLYRASENSKRWETRIRAKARLGDVKEIIAVLSKIEKSARLRNKLLVQIEKDARECQTTMTPANTNTSFRPSDSQQARKHAS